MSLVAALRVHREQWVGVALVNVATFTWATNMALGRWLRADIGPLTLAAARFVIASACFAALLGNRPVAERRLGTEKWRLIGMSLAGVVAFGPTLYLGLRHTSAVNATLINGVGPLLTGVLAAWWLSEPMSGRQVTGALVGLAGVAGLLIGGSQVNELRLAGSGGDLVVLAATLLWSIYSVLGRQVMKDRSAISATGLTAWMGTPLLLLAAIWEQQHLPVQVSGRLLLAVAYIGFVPTVIGFASWNAGVRRLGPSGAMVFYNTLPLYGALIGWLFLGETIGVAHLVGGVLIVGGGLWAARRSREAEMR